MLKLTLPYSTKIFAALSVLALTACDQQVQLDVASSPVSATLPEEVSIRISPDQVCADTSFKNAEGKTVQGERNCKDMTVLCQKMGDTYCMMEDANLYGVLDENLTAQNVKKGIPFRGTYGELLSNLGDCSGDGATDCIVPSEALALSGGTLKAKVVEGQKVAGVTGEFDPGFPGVDKVLATDTVNGVAGTIPACAADGESSCDAGTAFRAVALNELVPSAIRNSVTLGGVTGTYTGQYSACTADNQASCITTSDFISVDKNAVDPAKIRNAIVLAGKTGTLIERAANCAVSDGTSCVTTSSFPAADFSRITAANIKNGVTIAGLTGLYPSTSHKLSNDSGADDLTAGIFNARMALATPFEYWDSAGNRYVGAGDTDLAPGNIITGTNIFDVTGAMAGTPAPCSDTLSLDCVATASHVAYDASLLVPQNIKKDTVLAAVTGQYPSAVHPLVDNTATTDLTAANFKSRMVSADNFEFWDATGAKFTHSGTTDLVGTNIVTGNLIFGVSGALATRPADCSNSLSTECVTTATYPAFDPAVLHEGVIKSGESVGGVAGKYPSVTYPLADQTATLDLTSGNFSAQLSQATTFEYWDSAGQRYTGQGDTLLTSAHIRSGTTVHGVNGNITATSADCISGNDTGCVANGNFPAFRKSDLTAGVIKAGETIMAVAGQYPSATYRLNGADAGIDDLGNQADLSGRLDSATGFEYWDASGTRHVGNGDADLAVANLVTGKDIFGVAGNMVEQPDPCSSEGDTGCLTTATYPSFDKTILTKGVLKSGESLGGIMGEFPSATYPLKNASNSTTDLTQAGFNGQVASAGTYEFWDSAGNRQTKTVAANILATQVLSGRNIFGVAGSASGPPVSCSAAKITDCITTASYPSHVPADFTAGIVKKNHVIGATTGDYPSATHPLDGSSNTIDITATDFASRIKNSATFEYWDSAGVRYTDSGSDDILAANLKLNVDVFGAVGTLDDGSSASLTPDQIRYGVTIGGVTGTLKLNCRNNSATNSTPEIDDYNNGNLSMPSHSSWGAAHDCSSGIFVDVTAGGPCDHNDDLCIYKDSITGLQWRELSDNGANGTWTNGKNSCFDGWRMPTAKELQTAYIHGLRNTYLMSQRSFKFPDTSPLWSSTISSFTTDQSKVWRFNFGTHETIDVLKSQSGKTLCVK